jgi:hypothetical protein
MAFWEQIKDKTQALQIKLRMVFLENQIETFLLRLGSRTYELSKKELPFAEDGEARSLFQEISSRKQELARLKEEFQRSWRFDPELKSTWRKGTALERVKFLSPPPERRSKSSPPRSPGPGFSGNGTDYPGRRNSLAGDQSPHGKGYGKTARFKGLPERRPKSRSHCRVFPL